MLIDREYENFMFLRYVFLPPFKEYSKFTIRFHIARSSPVLSIKKAFAMYMQERFLVLLNQLLELLEVDI